MAIPRASDRLEEQRSAFARLASIQLELQQSYPLIDTLSMGMSSDLEAAIVEGATIVRIGTALFGPRKAQPPSA